MYNYNIETEIELKRTLAYIKDKDAEIAKLQFERKCMTDRYYSYIKSLCPFPYITNKVDFYKNVMKYVNKESDDSDEYDLLLGGLKHYIPNINGFTKAYAEGYDFHGLVLEFSIDGAEYQIYLPIINNISKDNIIYKTGEINTDIAKINIFRRNGEYSWSRIWSGYDMVEGVI